MLDQATTPGETVNKQSTPGGAAVELIGMIELAERTGVARQTARQWQQRGLLPTPDFTVSGTPAWKSETIKRWAAKTGRTYTEETKK